MKIYVAGGLETATDARQLMTELEQLGCTITYDWTSHGPAPIESRPAVAAAEIEGVRSCDVLVVRLPGGSGTHVEMGIALGLRKPVVLLLPPGQTLEDQRPCFYWGGPGVAVLGGEVGGEEYPPAMVVFSVASFVHQRCNGSCAPTTDGGPAEAGAAPVPSPTAQGEGTHAYRTSMVGVGTPARGGRSAPISASRLEEAAVELIRCAQRNEMTASANGTLELEAPSPEAADAIAGLLEPLGRALIRCREGDVEPVIGVRTGGRDVVLMLGARVDPDARGLWIALDDDDVTEEELGLAWADAETAWRSRAVRR